MDIANPASAGASEVVDGANYRFAPEEPALEEDGAETAPEVRECVTEAPWHAMRLDKALVEMAPEFSRSHLQSLMLRGHVRVNGVVADTASRKLRVGQVVRLELVPTDESLAFRPEPIALNIVFEDAQLMVLHKPAGLVVHPAAGHWSGTLLNGVLAHHPAASQLPRAGIVHRLDKDTSGLMVVGKTLGAVTALSRAIAARQVHRRYLAIAHGTPVQTEFTVDQPLARDPASRVKMAVVKGGKPARTDFTVVHQTPAPLRIGASKPASNLALAALECTLHTGRTHQIRVHLAHLGHPLVADAVYGGRPMLGMERQALHAFELQFMHPATGAALAFECPPPADFAAAWAQVLRSA